MTQSRCGHKAGTTGQIVSRCHVAETTCRTKQFHSLLGRRVVMFYGDRPARLQQPRRQRDDGADHLHTIRSAEQRVVWIMAGHLDTGLSIQNVLAGQMTHPFFPVPIDIMKARIEFVDFKAGDTFNIENDIKVRTAPLNHPDGATGYRLDYQGRSVCYITDTEHTPGSPDQKILALIEGADLVIYDSTYTDHEFQTKRGWGHSTWQEGVRLARLANAKRLAIFHHDPDHEDHFMEEVEANALAAWPGCITWKAGLRSVPSA